MQEEKSAKKSNTTQYTTPLALLALVGELGFIISLPLLAMVMIGIQLDRWLQKSPLFLIIGIVLAALFSSVLVGYKVKKVSDEA